MPYTTALISLAFQFTHPGGVRPTTPHPTDNERCFNSRTREGCDRILPSAERCARAEVSIHAPGRGATWGARRSLLLLEVSIHAPGRGATNLTNLSSSCFSSFNSRTREGCDIYIGVSNVHRVRFNSRTREGCDRCIVPVCYIIAVVSIHAPGRGATTKPRKLPLRSLCFNSRTREGCDWEFPHTSGDANQFQFTHPGGVRHVRI